MLSRSRFPVLAVLAVLFIPCQLTAASAKLTPAEVRQAERWLADLGFWTGPVDGVWDEATRHALVAFQKLERAKPTGRLTRAEWNALSVATPIRPRRAPQGTGPHVEVDIARQVLFLVDAGGRVANIVPISSGSGKRFFEAGYPETHAVTPCGPLEVFQKRSGWHKSPLGEMHNPLYIVGGIAIHGSTDVPPYPASHGCIRIPMFASHRLTQMVPKGTPVHVYGCEEKAAKGTAVAVR